MKVPSGKEFVELFKETFADFGEDKAPRLGAALSFYTIFSMAPLLVVVMGIVGIFYSGGDKLLDTQMQSLLGKEGAEAVHQILENANKNQTGGIIATIVGTVTLLLGAGGLFGQLQDALNTIWEVQPKAGQGFMAMVKNRFLSFTMVLGTGFILLVSLFLNAMISGAGDYVHQNFGVPEVVQQIINFIVAFAVTTLLFAMIYKVLPDAEINWRDVWIGAAVTSLLFGIGKFALGWYLGRGSIGSAYGAAGSLAVLLMWIYYAAQILFFGAEFTQVYAKKFGSKIVPSPNAEPMSAEERAKQGLSPSDGGPIPAGAAVAIAHPHGIAGAKSPQQLQKQRDMEFLWPAAVGFLSILLFAERRKKN